MKSYIVRRSKNNLEELKGAIGEEDLKHIYELLEIVKTSCCHLELWRRKIKKKTRRYHS